MAAETYTWADPGGAGHWTVLSLRFQVVISGITTVLIAAFGLPGSYRGDLRDLLEIPDALSALAVLSGWVATGRWLARANRNAHVLNPSMRYGPLGMVLFYFVPIANFFAPYWAMAELWDSSAGESSARGARSKLRAWWAVFVGGEVLILGGLGTFHGEDPRLFTVTVWALQTGSAYLFIGIVRQITQMQIERCQATVFSENEPIAR